MLKFIFWVNYDENNLTSEFADYEQEEEDDEENYEHNNVEYEMNERRAPMKISQASENKEDLDEAENMPIRHNGK